MVSVVGSVFSVQVAIGNGIRIAQKCLDSTGGIIPYQYRGNTLETKTQLHRRARRLQGHYFQHWWHIHYGQLLHTWT
eukprot:3005657-Amphidinium_carterae.1